MVTITIMAITIISINNIHSSLNSILFPLSGPEAEKKCQKMTFRDISVIIMRRGNTEDITY